MNKILIIVISFICCSFLQEKTVSNEGTFEIHFEILPEKVKSLNNMTIEEYLDLQIMAVTTRTFKPDSSKMHQDSITEIFMGPLMIGYKELGDNYIEAFDLKGEEIDIHGEMDYSYYFNWDDYATHELRNGDTFIDTFGLSGLYKFRKEGTYLIRFVENNEEESIYSNWDTLKVY